VGEVRRLRAAPGAGWNGPAAARSPIFSGSSGRLSRTPPASSAALQNAEVDWYEQAQADLVPQSRRNSDIVIAPSNPQGYIDGLRFNCLHSPFDDVHLRRAVPVSERW
jgi:ABC-type transport system substrate-binding protein